MASDEKLIKAEGVVEEALPGLQFRVSARDSALGEKYSILAHLGGKMKMHHIRVIPGDRVLVEMAPIDKTRGRIVRRL